MGFGFVVARFGLFLQQLEVTAYAPLVPAYGSSLWFGTALISAGVAVNILSAWQHARLVRQLARGGLTSSGSPIQAFAIAVFLALFGLVMAIYLVSVRGLPHPQEKERSMGQIRDNGVIRRPSEHSVDGTVERLRQILQTRGITLFALVDHSGEAEKVGIKMRPTKLLIFGNPKGGTPVMLAAPSSAIDLPLKMLVSEDTQGKVWISYNSPAYLEERHGLPPQLLQNLQVAETLATEAGR
jgi:uncharacterized protein (DUF302 family)